MAQSKPKYDEVDQEEYEIETVSGNSSGCGSGLGSRSTQKSNSKSCGSTDIEDIATPKLIPAPKLNNIIRDEKKMELIIDEMLKTDIKSHDEMSDFIKVMQKKYRETLCGGALLYFYRKYCQEGKYEYNIKYEKLLRVKSYRSDIGVLVCASFTSPYPGIDLVKNVNLWKWLMRREIQKGDDEIKNLYKGMDDNIYADLDTEINISPEEIKEFEDKYFKAGEFSCKGNNCFYCPRESGMPRSYYLLEPGVLRAFHNMFDPVLQTRDRIRSYESMGHPIDKIEYLVLGGTWTSYEKNYRDWYITSIYYALNTYFDNPDTRRAMLSLKEERKINETALCKMIGLTLEMRPDSITPKVCKELRDYGVTRVQIGVQSIYDKYLYRINRGCNHKKYENAAKLLTMFGVKFDIHIMLDLPQPFKDDINIKNLPRDENDNVLIFPNDIDWDVDVAMDDVNMLWHFIFDPNCIAYQYKIYPCETGPFTNILIDYKNGAYKPYGNTFFTKAELEEKYNISDYPPFDINQVNEEYIDKNTFFNNFKSFMAYYIDIKTKQMNSPNNWTKKEKRMRKAGNFVQVEPKFNLLFMIIMYFKMHVKKYTRLNRVIRDIPELYHRAGVQKSNTRQLLHEEMAMCGFKCNCIRCRQVKNNKFNPDDVKLYVYEYEAHGGLEYHIEYASDNGDTLIGFLRLRMHTQAGYDLSGNIVTNDLIDAIMITELHVYGEVLATYNDNKGSNAPQHSGYGKLLLQKAFEIAKENNYNKISVIPGDGVKRYYEKYGFKEGEYFHIKYFDDSK